MNTKSTYNKILFSSISIILVSIALFYLSVTRLHILCSDCNIEINKNDNANIVAYKLVEKNVLSEPYSFLLASKLLFLDKLIKPGKYDLSDISNMKQLLLRITSSEYDYTSITIPEGWTVSQIAQKLDKSNLADSLSFKILCSDNNFINELKLSGISNLEGYLFPETYFISSNQNEKQIITMMVNQFKKIVTSHQFNYEKYDFNFHDLITLASIVQGEARDINEMSTISSVFHNRLNKNMYLDANATIQYIIPGENRRLRNKDLEINNRYNTYKYKGLPPGPINNPGLDAIIAASKPLTTDFLYFVKDPENLGKHVFNKTFKDHEKARKKYLKDLRINGFK